MARRLHQSPGVNAQGASPARRRPLRGRGSSGARARARGFTLIEMMTVVIIISVLATLAVVGYRKIIQSAHVTEATNMVQSIRVAQEAYHAETQQYANISASLGSWYPNPTPNGQTVTQWGGACGGACLQDWSTLPVHVDGPVMFGYATQAGPSNSNPAALPAGFPAIQLPAPSATDWYMVTASCDIDGQGAPNTLVLTTSWSNQVFTYNEGF